MAPTHLRPVPDSNTGAGDDGPFEDGEDLVVNLRIKDLGDLMRTAHKELLVTLLSKVQQGAATHQEMAILRNLLRDNGMVISPHSPQQTQDDAKRPPADLPDLPTPDYET